MVRCPLLLVSFFLGVLLESRGLLDLVSSSTLLAACSIKSLGHSLVRTIFIETRVARQFFPRNMDRETTIWETTAWETTYWENTVQVSKCKAQFWTLEICPRDMSQLGVVRSAGCDSSLSTA